MRREQVEVLAPAGSFESMKAAIGAGADGVYIGGSRFGARAYADNLDQERMLEAIDYAHVHGVSLYMTVNTLMKEDELEELPRFLRPYYEQGLDGVIVQDLGAVSVIRQRFPDLPVHASTQMTITGVHGARILAELGVKRVVTARELSLDEIRRIHEEVPVEIECFVHGALCYCYSGQCLLSSFIGGRSGNRGRCAQPCRLPYVVREAGRGLEASDGRRGKGKTGKRAGDERRTGQDGLNFASGRRKASPCRDDPYILSMKDLCTLDLLPDLMEAGVCSLKIEGRMKSPRYTAGVTRIYRKYADLYFEKGREGYCVDPADRQELLDLFDRGGFTDGYYRQHNGPGMIARKEKPAFRQGNEKLFDQLDRLYVKAEKKEPVEGVLTVKEGEKTCLELRLGREPGDGGTVPKAMVWGPEAQTAKNQPISREQLEKQIRKTGDMPFRWERLDIRLQGNVFLPVQALNELRRQGLERLRQSIVDEYRRECPVSDKSLGDPGGKEQKAGISQKEKPKLHVLLSGDEGFPQILNIPQVSRIYMEADAVHPKLWETWTHECHAREKDCFLAMPVIFCRRAERFFQENFSFLLEAGFDGFLVRNLEEIGYLQSRGVKVPIYGDHNLYAFNSASQDMLGRLGCEGTTFPLELNNREMERLTGRGRELTAYGFLPVMVSAQCVEKTVYGCSKRPGRLMMKDRRGKELPVENHCVYCYNLIYNPLPLSLMDQWERIRELAPEAVRLQFTWESPDEIRQVAAAWAEVMYKGDKAGGGTGDGEAFDREKRAGDFTRGHFKRGVE